MSAKTTSTSVPSPQMVGAARGVSRIPLPVTASVCAALGSSARVVIESTGRYGLDLTLTLHAAEGIEVMVANPKALRGYAKAQMRRTKTDEVDAEVSADYARRMPFTPWEPPEEAITELQAIARRIQALTVEQTRESSRHVRRTACSRSGIAAPPRRLSSTTSKSISVTWRGASRNSCVRP